MNVTDFSIAIYRKRLDTLKHWPFTKEDGASCTAEELARVGFFCPDPETFPDALRCFVCHKELDGWEPTDSPIEEHKSHSAKCKYLRIGCKDFANMTVKEYLDVVVKSQMEYSMGIAKKKELETYDTGVNAQKKQFLAYLNNLGLHTSAKTLEKY